jgi:long-subunit fatty acid transport protein
MRFGPLAAALAGLGAWLAWCGPAGAQTDVWVHRGGSGARAAGMGDAFIAVSDDGTAASWNPAGLAQLRQPEFSLVYGVTDRDLEFTAGRSTDGRFGYTAHGAGSTSGSIDFASAALPLKVAGKPVTLQGGWHRLYQLSGEIGGSTRRVPLFDSTIPPVSIDHVDRLDGAIDVLSVSGAVKVTDRVALGTSVNFWRGDWIETDTLVEDPGPAGPTAFFSGTSQVRLRGTNAALGLLLTYPSWSLGLVHHWPFWSSYHGTGTMLSSLGPAVHQEIPDARFRFPRSFGVGGAGRLPSRWTVAVSITYDDWTDAVVDRFPGIPGEINFFDGYPPDLTTTRDTVSLNLGAEHLFVLDGSVIPLRFGLGWEPQGGMDPVTRDPVDFHMVAAGLGYNTNALKFDAAVQLRWAGTTGTEPLSVVRHVEGPQPADAIGRASSHEWRVKVSAIYRLP